MLRVGPYKVGVDLSSAGKPVPYFVWIDYGEGRTESILQQPAGTFVDAVFAIKELHFKLIC